MDEFINILINEIEKRYFRGLSFSEAYGSVIKDIKKDGVSHLIYKSTLIIS
ncbi:hypothetical protein QJR32_07235 [Clostridium baratii]|uniref:hypothetical protein n=1 Tax=Clostridium baratii TaxID=1561 RepID=UPI0030D5F6B8